MRKILITSAIAIAAASAVAAQDCDQASAEKKWLAAEDADVVLGISMLDGLPTIHMDEAIFRQLNDTVRAGMVATFQCAVVGPDTVMPEVQFATTAGRVLATFDGIRKRLEMH